VNGRACACASVSGKGEAGSTADAVFKKRFHPMRRGHRAILGYCLVARGLPFSRTLPRRNYRSLRFLTTIKISLTDLHGVGFGVEAYSFATPGDLSAVIQNRGTAGSLALCSARERIRYAQRELK
jgi:hypothetical protein